MARWLLPIPQSVVVAAAGVRERLAEEALASPSGTAEAMLPTTAVVSSPTGLRYRANVRVLIRNHEISGRDVEFRTNQYGFRGPPISAEKRRPRVLFLGDHITAASYLDEEATFVHRLTGVVWPSTRTTCLPNVTRRLARSGSRRRPGRAGRLSWFGSGRHGPVTLPLSGALSMS